MLKYEDIQKYAGGFDGRALKALASPRAFEDLNAFIEKIPQNTGKTILIITAVVWVFAAVSVLYTTVQLQELTKLRAALQSAEAVQPKVPKIEEIPAPVEEVEDFATKIKDIYTGLNITTQGAALEITGSSTAGFGQFREAIGHVQNGGSGWRIILKGLCVGRECDRVPLSAVLGVNKVSVN